ncbi:unnamed protein product [Thelazia callipaeda]|uniref:Uncharacterized protein n=1 Tax=Thelazia callipaeda TaxID=103827 RepID=A0A0N5CLR8_THECL|nr:unnamed protein product [Thelazia callipaeda]
MRNMLEWPVFKFLRFSTTSNNTQPSLSTQYQQLKEDDDRKDSETEQRITKTEQYTTNPIRISKIRTRINSSDYTLDKGSYSDAYMLSFNNEKYVKNENMDELDRVPVDFSTPSAPTLLTDPNEVGLVCIYYFSHSS